MDLTRRIFEGKVLRLRHSDTLCITASLRRRRVAIFPANFPFGRAPSSTPEGSTRRVISALRHA